MFTVRLFHFPYVLVKSFMLFLTNSTEIVRKVVCVNMKNTALYSCCSLSF
jgi:hypothetical protein